MQHLPDISAVARAVFWATLSVSSAPNRRRRDNFLYHSPQRENRIDIKRSCGFLTDLWHVRQVQNRSESGE